MSTADLEFFDPTLDDRYDLAIALQLRRFTIGSHVLWLAHFVPLYDSYLGIHDALLQFGKYRKQEIGHVQ